MNEPQVTDQETTRIIGVSLLSSYVGDYAPALDFYVNVLGLEKAFDMGENACYLKLGEDSGLYLEGGNHPASVDPKTVRPSFALSVASASAMYVKLAAAGIRMVHEAPLDMGQENFWFQFYDPSGNILEVLGGR